MGVREVQHISKNYARISGSDSITAVFIEKAASGRPCSRHLYVIMNYVHIYRYIDIIYRIMVYITNKIFLFPL